MIEITVINNGNITGIGALTITIGASTDGVTTVPGITLAALTVRRTSFRAHVPRKFTLHLKVPASLAAGLYFPVAAVTFDGSPAKATGAVEFTVS